MTEQDIFPGWDFDITTEEKISKQPVKILQESLDKMSLDQRRTFTREIVQKHTNYGAISMFKGVEEIRFAKIKSNAKTFISELRRDIDLLELEISNLEKELLESRMTISRGSRDISRLKKELIQIFPQVITPFTDLHHLKEKSLEYEDLPNDSRLQFNKAYSDLKGQISRLIVKVEECTRKIPEIEEKLGPARHRLAVLRVEEDELRPLDDKIDEIDLQEKVEKEIVERFRRDRQEKRMIAANDRARKLKESLEIQKLKDKILQEQKEEELKEKRKHLMSMLKEDMHKIEKEKRHAQEQEIEAKNKKLKALKKLDEKVKKLKDKIVPTTQNECKTGKESEIDVIKKQIKAKELKKEFEKKKKEERREAMEERKMMILDKLIKENERFESKKKAHIPKKVVQFEDSRFVTQEEVKPSPSISTESITALLNEESKLLSGVSSRQRKRLPPPRHKYVPPETDTFVLNGPPFSISKSSFDFVDYDPSKKYSQKISLTNISRRVNTFKIVSFPLEYSDIFSIQLDAPGYVNPGMKTKGTIFFHPPTKLFSEEIETKIELLAEWGGNFTIPISCKKKRSAPSFNSVHGPGYKDFTMPGSIDKSANSFATAIDSASLISLDHLVLNYGECTEGDRRTLVVEIINRGALPCDYVVNAPESHYKDYVYELDCERESTLPGYGKMKIKVMFMPGVLDYVAEKEKMDGGERPMTYEFSIEYTNGSKLMVSCSGSRAKSSIKVQPRMVDFDLCSVGQSYKRTITLINHINIATKIWITADGLESNVELDRLCVQSERIGDIEIHPSSAYVQSNDAFPILLRIIPNSKAAQISNNGESEFELTIHINYMQKDGKRNYTPLYITGRITGNKIILSPAIGESAVGTLDFGRLSILECKHLSLKVENTSRASQEVELFSNDPHIMIISEDTTENNQILFLKPKETVIKTVRFEPESYGPFSCNIVAKNKWNQKFKISVKGFGHVPPLKFLNDQYVFPDTSVGTTKTTIFILKRTENNLNESSDCQYEFGDPFPDPANQNTALMDPILRLTPQIGVFSGKMTIPIEVALTPNMKQTKVSPMQNTDHKLDDEVDKVVNVDDQHSIAPFFISYIVPCYLKPHLNEADRMQSLVNGSFAKESRKDDQRSFEESVIYFKISATIFQPEIVLCDSTDSELNFGLVTLRTKAVKSFMIKNASSHNIMLKSSCLNPSGGFFLVKALREVRPNETFQIKIGFQPESAHIYREYFELYTPTTTLKVRLDGEGIFPELDVDFKDSSVQFEDTIIGETSSRKIKIWNKKHYQISFFADLASLSSEADKKIFAFSSWHCKHAFNVNPKRAKLEPNSFVEFDISFQPTIEADNYRDVLKLNIKGNSSAFEIPLNGRGWESSSYLSGYDLDTESSMIFPAEKSYSNVLKNLAGIDGFLVPDASGKGVIIDEENLAIMAQSPYKKDTYYSTLTCYWNKLESDGSEDKWELDLKDIIVMNIKPPGIKLDGGKRSTECEYTIEPLESTFNYHKDLNQFVLERSGLSPTDSHFAFETLNGTVPIDSSTRIKLKVINPIKSYWKDFHEKWTQYGSLSEKTLEDGNEKIHPKFRNQIDRIKSKLEFHHASKPSPIETCFKITLKGGYRYAEPKGPMSPYDARVWILKVVAKVDE